MTADDAGSAASDLGRPGRFRWGFGGPALTDGEPEGPVMASASGAVPALVIAPQARFLVGAWLAALGGFGGVLSWGLVRGPVHHRAGRLVSAWERGGALAVVAAAIVYVGWEIARSSLVCSTVCVVGAELSHEFRLGPLWLRRSVPLASLVGLELRELLFKGQSARPGRLYRLVAVVPRGSELTLVWRLDRHARGRVLRFVRSVNEAIRRSPDRLPGAGKTAR
jgi:hypothetical protein